MMFVKSNLRIGAANRQTGQVKVKVTTLEGKKMTARGTTVPIGSGLRIAPGFVASAVDEESGIETALEAHYRRDEGRYIVTTVVNRAVRDEFDSEALRRLSSSAILQAAIPECIAIDVFDNDRWTTVANISAVEGRLIPEWMAKEVIKRGQTEARMDVIEILYGASALAGLPPVKAVQRELNVPHRTASDWIMKARKAGRLEGMNYAVGRQAEG
ncbi:hypothetical protein GCM10025760_29490 [Microbacterium yannicii]|uniref:ASCH domain-containing protein n=1 Tax=Microbacterium yannicii TaxID=671622 RepID=A0ABP9MLP2_9MICO|nr:hypothetical protein [Microbacterium yannicii]MCO5953269.1 hypothetical protein [Microbacterium yannicii]